MKIEKYSQERLENLDILLKQFQPQKAVSITGTVTSLLDHDSQLVDTSLAMRE